MKRRLAEIWRRINEKVGEEKEKRESNGLVREEREEREKREKKKFKRRGEGKV